MYRVVKCCFGSPTFTSLRHYVFHCDFRIYETNYIICSHCRRFGGFALSVADWASNVTQFIEDLSGQTDFQTEPFFGVGYDSPFKADNRRNEIWFRREKTQRNVEEAAEDNSEDEDDEYEVEELPYEVVKENEVCKI